MNSLAHMSRSLRALGLGLLFASASLSAQTVSAIRTQLTQGNYSAAATAADLTIKSTGVSPTDLANARFYRAYSLLIDSVEKEGMAGAKKIGATTANIDLFAQNVDVQFPEAIVYAKPGLFAPFSFSKTAASYLLPKGFDFLPVVSFTNADASVQSLKINIDASDYWRASLEDTTRYSFGSLWGDGDRLEGYSDLNNLFVESGDDSTPQSFTLDLEPGQKIDLRIHDTADTLKFSIASPNPKITTLAVSPFTKSVNTLTLKADYYVAQPALTFENQGTAPYNLVLDFGSSSFFGANVNLNGHNEGFLYTYNGEINSNIDNLGTLSANRISFTIPTQSALTLIVYRASSDFYLKPFGTLPKTLLVKNGAYVSGKYPKFAASSNSSLLFTTLASLDANTLGKIIADLTAIPANHENHLSAQESLQGREITIQHADRQAALALLKFVQAISLLGKTIDLGFDFSPPGFYEDLDPLAFVTSSKTLLGAGKSTPAERVRLRTLLSESAEHTLAALDAGIQTRSAPVDAEYLFALSDGSVGAPRIALESTSYRFTSQIAYDGSESIAFRNTTGSEKTLVLRFEGKPTDPDYFTINSAWLAAAVYLDGAPDSLLFADAATFSSGSYDYVFDPNTGEYNEVFQRLGSFVYETGEWTVTIPANSTLRLDFHTAALDALITPVSGLPSGVQTLIGVAAIEEARLRTALTDFKTALTGTIPAARLGLDGLPDDTTLSLAPLFAAKPVNIRSILPQIGSNGVLRGDSARLLSSGFFGKVSVTDWESFLSSRDALDLVTPPKVTPLKITSQPIGADLAKGANYTLAIAADGYPAPTYQWLKNGQPIQGAISSTYQLSEVDSLDIASYQVRLLGGANTEAKPLLSAVAKVNVKDAPRIIEQPTTPSTLIPASTAGNLSLSVGAVGYAPLSYQWFKDGQPISKATANKLTFKASTCAGTYHVVVTNAYGTATSESVKLTVLTIGTLPKSLSVSIGKPLSIPLSVSGAENLSYLWRKNGEDLPDQTSSTLSIPEVTRSDAGSYSLIVYAAGSVYISPSVTVNVNYAPSTLTEVGTSMRFTGNGFQAGVTYYADRIYTITAAGKASGVDLVEGYEGTATYTYKFINATTAEISALISGSGNALGFKETQNVRLTFTTPDYGTYTTKGSDNVDGGFTESGSFTINTP